MRWLGSGAAAALVVLLLLASHAGYSAGLDEGKFVSVDELKPGDSCVGKTVFSGSGVEEFAVEIIGVVRGASPGGNLIIGRASGGAIDEAGIMEGMSGSPVYLDGRLVGACAGAWAFSKEPIAAITPIEELLPALEMLDESAEGPSGGSRGAALGVSLMPEGELASSRAGWLSSVCGISAAREPSPLTGALGSYGGREMAPIASPLVVSCGDDRFLKRISGMLRGSGLAPTRGAAGAEAGSAADLVPGSAVGVQFVRGDVSWTAIGTVTYREDDRIIAFGHPLFNTGVIEMPMVGAFVHTVMPLQTISFKYASGTELVGTMIQDRRRAVAGRVGPPPVMLPLRVDVRTSVGDVRTYEFEVARAEPYVSVFAGLVAASTITEAVKAIGPSSVELAIELVTADEVIDYSNTFYTTDPAFRCGGELTTLMDLILLNEFEDSDIERAKLEVSIVEERRSAQIERVDAEALVYRPGEDVRARVVIRNWQGSREVETIVLRLPSSVPEGAVVLRVGGAADYHVWEAERRGGGLRPRSYRQLLDLIDRSKPQNVVVAQILSREAGLSLSGDEMRGVPGRAALAIASSATSGAVDRTDLNVLAETEFAFDRAVTGYHELELRVQEDR
jgi:hypothetical protein